MIPAEINPDEVTELQKICAQVVQATRDAGCLFLYLGTITFRVGSRTESVEALLCPMPREGYPSRLYFSRQVAKAGLNWNGNLFLLGKNWYAVSWMLPKEKFRLAEMVALHLRAFQ